MFFEIKVLTGALLKRCSITGKVKLLFVVVTTDAPKVQIGGANPVIQSGYDVKSFVKLLHC